MRPIINPPSTAPGSDLAQAALGYAEMEALEQFAAAEPAATCRPLTEHPDLDRADSLVRAFRARRKLQRMYKDLIEKERT